MGVRKNGTYSGSRSGLVGLKRAAESMRITMCAAKYQYFHSRIITELNAQQKTTAAEVRGQTK
jgi:hypothetical protein